MKRKLSFLLVSLIITSMMSFAYAESNVKEDHAPVIGKLIVNEDIAKVIRENKEYLDEDFIKTVNKIIELKKCKPNLSTNEIKDIISRTTTRGLLSEAGVTWDNLTDAEKTLVIAYPEEALYVNIAKNKTDELTNEHYPGWIDGDEGNAFRHATWNALMSRYIGKRLAEKFATAHENHGLTDEEYEDEVWNNHNGLEHKNMDLHNNKKGRECIKWSDIVISDKKIVARVKEKIKNNEMIRLVTD